MGNSLGELDPDRLPQHLKREGNDWFAVFNPRVQRVLDIDLVLTLTHQNVVSCVCFSLDGRFVATGCERSAQIFDVDTGSMVALLQDSSLLKDGDLYICSVCFSPDGKYLATGAEDGVVRVSSSSSLFPEQVLIAIRSGIFKTAQSNMNLPDMTKLSTRSTLLATVV
jgi:glucose repression regulatory protein TUP1